MNYDGLGILGVGILDIVGYSLFTLWTDTFYNLDEILKTTR